MNIRLDKIIPEPLNGLYENDSIWGRDLVFEGGKKYLVNAPSGKGKSTLLSYIYGLRNDFSGRLFLDEVNTFQMTVSDWSKIRSSQIAILFQDLRLFEGLTALENIEIKRKIHSETDKEIILKYAEILGVAELLKKPVSKLSMGQQQRIAFLRSLSQPFQWLLLDEPFSHLDVENAEKLADIAFEHCKENNAGLIVTNLGAKLNLSFDESVKV